MTTRPSKVENSPNYLDPQTLASLEGIDLQARLVVEGYVAGIHPSPYHGFSVEFVVAALAYMLIQQQDSVGLGLFDDSVRRYLRPASQPSPLKELFHVLDVTAAREKSNVSAVLHT